MHRYDKLAPAGLADEGNTCALLGAIGMGARGIGGRPQSAAAGVTSGAASAAFAAAAAPAPAPPAKSDGSDRRVLRFFCSWDDRSNGAGEVGLTVCPQCTRYIS